MGSTINRGRKAGRRKGATEDLGGEKKGGTAQSKGSESLPQPKGSIEKKAA